jgi:dTDP-4-dehydrorhamnose reductase
MRQTILVTGANGQLGQSIFKIVPNNEAYSFIFATSKELDVSSKESVAKYFSKHQPNWCINCAAYTAVDAAEKALENAEKVNVIGVNNLVEACKNHKTTLIHISTDFVFDGTKKDPYKENDITNPLGVYGRTKLEGEKAIVAGLTNYFIIRTSWLYSEFGNNFLKTMLRLAQEREVLHVVSDQIGTPTYAGDLAEVLLQMIKSYPNYGVYHYSNEGITSWYDFAVAIFKIADKETKVLPITSEAYPTQAKRPRFSVLDKSKIKNDLSLTIPKWEVSLERVLKLYKNL